jgi:hypothetical protein
MSTPQTPEQPLLNDAPNNEPSISPQGSDVLAPIPMQDDPHIDDNLGFEPYPPSPISHPLETSPPTSPTTASSTSEDLSPPALPQEPTSAVMIHDSTPPAASSVITPSTSTALPQELASSVLTQDPTPLTLRSLDVTTTASEASSAQDSSLTSPAEMNDKKKALFRDFVKLLERYDKNASKLAATPEDHLANYRVKTLSSSSDATMCP